MFYMTYIAVLAIEDGNIMYSMLNPRAAAWFEKCNGQVLVLGRDSSPPLTFRP